MLNTDSNKWLIFLILCFQLEETELLANHSFIQVTFCIKCREIADRINFQFYWFNFLYQMQRNSRQNELPVLLIHSCQFYLYNWVQYIWGKFSFLGVGKWTLFYMQGWSILIFIKYSDLSQYERSQILHVYKFTLHEYSDTKVNKNDWNLRAE